MRDGQGQGLKTGHNTVTLASAHTSQHSPDWESIPLGKEKLRCHNLQSKGCRGILFSFWFMATKGQSSFFLFYNPTLAPAWKKNIDISFIQVNRTAEPGQWLHTAWIHVLSPLILERMVLRANTMGLFLFPFLFSGFLLLVFFFPLYSSDPLSCAYELFYLCPLKTESIYSSTGLHAWKRKYSVLYVNCK